MDFGPAAIGETGAADTFARIRAIRAQLAQLTTPVTGWPVVSTPSAGSPGSSTAAAFATALDAAVEATTSAPPASTQRAVAGTAVIGTIRTQPTSSALPARSDGWRAPVHGRISSDYGPRGQEFHTGVDLAVPVGTPVLAASAGVVRAAGSKGGYGNAVIVDHGNGVSTLYAHNSKLLVEPGQRVLAGETLAEAGSTGRSTGPHLHLEVRVQGETVDPVPWLRRRGVRL